MLSRSDVVRRIEASGLVAIVRAADEEQALRTAAACLEGGVTVLEVTFTVPRAAAAIERLSAEFAGGEVIIGAGTVLDPETARVAILAGARFMVSPYLNPEVVRLANRYDIACLPGAQTVGEVIACMEAGAELVKAFPGEVLGPAFVKAVRGPLPYAKLVPTGGVALDNVGQWVKAGAAALGVGGNLTAGARTADYAKVTAVARQFVEAVEAARAS
jgi:2-dehydro-3-deoxyphosphogluconate aldolase/(4S)-4-hydroxy-2-oxoglutarate aldolase